MNRKFVRLIIRGNVQGVGFRYFVWKQAVRLSILGTVKNMSNGSVYVLATGKTEDLMELIRICNEGPSGSIVDSIDINWEQTGPDFHKFEIVY